jgi:cell division protein ZapA
MNELSRGKVRPKNQAETKDGVTLLNVSILGKEFQVSCPADEKKDLLKAASRLDERMRDIRETGKVIGLERIAIMAGLNITHEFLQAKDKAEGKSTSDMLKKLNRKLDNALQSAQQLEI